MAWNPLKKSPVDVVIELPYLDVRTGPGRGYPIFHAIEKGESIRLIKRYKDWYKIKTLTGEQGWVARTSLNGAKTETGDTLVFIERGWNEYKHRKWELGVLLGDFSGATAFTALVGYHFTPNIATELKITNSYGDFSNGQLYGISLISLPFDNWKLSPFFSVGTGTLIVTPDSDLVQSEDRQEGVMTLGTGANYLIADHFLLRLEYNQHNVLTNRENNLEVYEWKAGFSVFF